MVSTMILDSPEIAVDHHHMVKRVVDLMRTSVDPLTLDDLAETAGLSPFYFARTFRSVAGLPPVEFQAALRFERAKQLLLTSPASVTDICFEVGYDSLGTFSSRFKRLTGIGPAQFRSMPDIVADMDMRNEAGKYMDISDVIPSVEGVITAPDGLSAHVYVGLFYDPIAACRPVVGKLLEKPGPFTLPQVPPGTYYLLAAALPDKGSPLEELLPGMGTFVAGTDPVLVTSPYERHVRTLTMRQLNPLDAPLLTALPALLL